MVNGKVLVNSGDEMGRLDGTVVFDILNRVEINQPDSVDRRGEYLKTANIRAVGRGKRENEVGGVEGKMRQEG